MDLHLPSGSPSSGPPRVFDQGETRTADTVALRDLRARFGHLTGEALIAAMVREAFPGEIAVASSFGAESAVVLHMVASIDPSVPVIFLNTGKLFEETLRYRDELQARLGLMDVRAAAPDPRQIAGIDPAGTLWQGNPNRCCHLRKVLPSRRALAGMAAQITGRKRFQTETRLAMPTIESADGQFKINPLAQFSREDVEAYMDRHGLPRHPLVAAGYPSIGCAPCTSRVAEGADYRSGRWAGSDKTECGLHVHGDGDGI